MLGLLCTGLTPGERQTIAERLLEAPPEREPGTAFERHVAQIMRGRGSSMGEVVGR